MGCGRSGFLFVVVVVVGDSSSDRTWAPLDSHSRRLAHGSLDRHEKQKQSSGSRRRKRRGKHVGGKGSEMSFPAFFHEHAYSSRFAFPTLSLFHSRARALLVYIRFSSTISDNTHDMTLKTCTKLFFFAVVFYRRRVVVSPNEGTHRLTKRTLDVAVLLGQQRQRQQRQ